MTHIAKILRDSINDSDYHPSVKRAIKRKIKKILSPTTFNPTLNECIEIFEGELAAQNFGENTIDNAVNPCGVSH